MKSKSRKMVTAAMLLALAIVFQFIKIQLITGIGVNVALALCALECGWTWAAGIGLLTPIFALILGVHPAVLIPVLPVIMLGNAVFAASVGLIGHNREGKGLDMKRTLGIITIPVLLKFLVIYFGVAIAISAFGVMLPAPIRAAVGLLQIPTAFSGTLITVVVEKALMKYRLSKGALLS